jgi:hypothetical protein
VAEAASSRLVADSCHVAIHLRKLGGSSASSSSIKLIRGGGKVGERDRYKEKGQNAS